jgi:hypothetical protein
LAAFELKKNNSYFWVAVGLATALIGLAIFFLFKSGDYVIFGNVWLIMKNLWWLILPVPIWNLFMMVWEEYTSLNFSIKQRSILLEIRPPADIEKSPKIMEQIFAGMHTYSTPNKFEIYCGWRPIQEKFSFEIASIEGKIHFYLRCPVAGRNMVESLIYAQYPDTEIFEAEDYTRKVPRKLPNRNWDVWGTVMKLVDDDAIPIRIYKYFKEDVTGKMIDPLASLTEVMGNIGKGQHIWIQFIFSPAAESEWQPKGKKKIEEMMGIAEKKDLSKMDRFFSDVKDVVVNVIRGLAGAEVVFNSGEDEKTAEFNIQRLSPGQQDKLRAIEENLSRPGFTTTIRFVYAAKRENFNKALGVAGVMGAFKQFSDVNYNSLVTDNQTKTFANYYFTQARLAYRQRKIIQDYRDRSFAGTGFFFNTEELATVFHFPDMSVKTPAIDRITAKKGEAPTNLPIGEAM